MLRGVVIAPCAISDRVGLGFRAQVADGLHAGAHMFNMDHGIKDDGWKCDSLVLIREESHSLRLRSNGIECGRSGAQSQRDNLSP